MRLRLVVALAVLGLTAPALEACSCSGGRPLCDGAFADWDPATMAVFVGRAGRTTGTTMIDALNQAPPPVPAPRDADPEGAKKAYDRAIREQAEAFVETWREDLSEEHIAEIRGAEKVWEVERMTGLSARTEFEVLEAFVGDLAERVAVGSGRGNCGLSFEPGLDYLVVAGRGEDGLLGTQMCMGTGLAEGGTHELEALRAWKQGKKPPRLVYGGVVDSTQGRQTRERTSLSLRLVGKRHTVSTATASDGYYRTFEFRDPPKDVYRLEVAEPGWGVAIVKPEAEEIDLESNRCAVLQVYVRQEQGTIRGRFREAPGSELGAPMAEAVRVGEHLRDYVYSKLGEGGAFEIAQVEPGSYRVAINVNNAPSGRGQSWVRGKPGHPNPYPPTFYPGVADPSEAAVFQVKRGETLDIGEWALPPPLAEVPMRVRVAMPDGTPARDARLILKRRLPRRIAEFARFGPTGADGALELILLEGVEVQAEVVARAGERVFRAEAEMRPGAEEMVLRLEPSEWRMGDSLFFGESMWGAEEK